jgi:GT2 family glycosyltransferase
MIDQSQSKVFVIVVNYNQDQYTVDCINSLLDSDYENFQICLIDNGSKAEVREKLGRLLPNNDKLTIHLLSKNLGYVGGVNYGLKQGEKVFADYYLIMNNDTLIAKHSISELVACAKKHQDLAIVSGKVFNYGEQDSLQYVGQAKDPNNGLNQVSLVKGKREQDVGQYDQEMEMGMLDDIFWLFPKSLYKMNGGYSEYFFLYGEQNDYAFRALKAGYKLIYTPTASLWHKGGVSTCCGDKASPRIEYWTTMATLKLAVLHLSESEAKKFCNYWPKRKLLKMLVLIVKGQLTWQHFKSVYTANRNFKHWNVVRYHDNGYNPF